MAVDATDQGGANFEAPIILTADRIRQTIRRISHEIIENNPDIKNLVILGVRTRGTVLANRIAAELKKISQIDLPCGAIDTSLYRDDYMARGPVMEAQPSEIPFGIDHKTILLVDDVLFTGRTVSAAIRHIFDLGRPAKIQLAVLIDRGHRELPIRPDYCGKNVPTQYVEKIRVRFMESDGQEFVISGLDKSVPSTGDGS